MGLGDLGFLHAKSSSGTQLQGIMGRRQMTDRKLVSKNVVLSNIFYNKKQLLIIYIYIYFPPWGLTALRFFFFFKELPRVGFHFCFTSPVTQWRHQVSWWAGKSLLRSPLVRGVPVGLGDRRSTPHWFLCSVRKTNQVICIDFCSQEENASSTPERARQLSELSRPLLLRLLGLVLFLVHDYGQLRCHFFFFLNPSVTWRIRSGRRIPVTILQLSKVLCRLFLTKHLGLSVNESTVSNLKLFGKKRQT